MPSTSPEHHSRRSDNVTNSRDQQIRHVRWALLDANTMDLEEMQKVSDQMYTEFLTQDPLISLGCLILDDEESYKGKPKAIKNASFADPSIKHCNDKLMGRICTDDAVSKICNVVIEDEEGKLDSMAIAKTYNGVVSQENLPDDYDGSLILTKERRIESKETHDKCQAVFLRILADVEATHLEEIARLEEKLAIKDLDPKVRRKTEDDIYLLQNRNHYINLYRAELNEDPERYSLSTGISVLHLATEGYRFKDAFKEAAASLMLAAIANKQATNRRRTSIENKDRSYERLAAQEFSFNYLLRDLTSGRLKLIKRMKQDIRDSADKAAEGIEDKGIRKSVKTDAAKTAINQWDFFFNIPDQPEESFIKDFDSMQVNPKAAKLLRRVNPDKIEESFLHKYLIDLGFDNPAKKIKTVLDYFKYTVNLVDHSKKCRLKYLDKYRTWVEKVRAIKRSLDLAVASGDTSTSRSLFEQLTNELAKSPKSEDDDNTLSEFGRIREQIADRFHDTELVDLDVIPVELHIDKKDNAAANLYHFEKILLQILNATTNLVAQEVIKIVNTDATPWPEYYPTEFQLYATSTVAYFDKKTNEEKKRATEALKKTIQAHLFSTGRDEEESNHFIKKWDIWNTNPEFRSQITEALLEGYDPQTEVIKQDMQRLYELGATSHWEGGDEAIANMEVKLPLPSKSAAQLAHLLQYSIYANRRNTHEIAQETGAILQRIQNHYPEVNLNSLLIALITNDPNGILESVKELDIDHRKLLSTEFKKEFVHKELHKIGNEIGSRVAAIIQDVDLADLATQEDGPQQVTSINTNVGRQVEGWFDIVKACDASLKVPPEQIMVSAYSDFNTERSLV